MPADTDQPTLAVTSQGQADARAYLLARCVATDQRSITVSKSLLEIACADTRTHSEPRPVAGLREALEKIMARQGWGEPTLADGSKVHDDLVVSILCTIGELRRARTALATLSPDPTSLEGGEGVDALAVEYAGEYVMSTEGSDYEPTQWERALILDALHGFIADHRLAAIPSTQGV